MNTFLDNLSSNHYYNCFGCINSSTNCVLLILLNYIMARITKFLKFIFHIAILTVISYFLKNQNPIKIVKKLERYIPDMKYILMWTRVPGVQEDGQRYFINHSCEHINCYFTMNRSLFEDLRYFDAIVFNVQDVSQQTKDLPKVRSLVQKYIFAANDSSDNYPVCSPVYENYFNWTWTYKPDSSIPYTFITVYNIHDEELGNNLHWNYNMKPITSQLKSTLNSKSLAAAIYLDKCVTTSKREYFLKSLQYHLAAYNLTVDVFGPCGTMKCGRTSLKPCFYRIRTTYYFYLALEDSIATDFITTSVLFAYHNSAVPIVLGGAQYHRYLPPDSYLDGGVLGEEIIAKIMYEAIKNKTKYYDFFKWRNHYTIKESTVLNACTLCEFMNKEGWLKTAASSAAADGERMVRLRCLAATVLTHVASQIRHLPFFQGTRVSPSGLFPSDLLRPGGSSTQGILIKIIYL